jgi:hypothetical protein
MMEIIWTGPYGWPKYEGQIPPVPLHAGVYLLTVEYRNGYLIYAAGLTRRPIRKRLTEHTRKYLCGDYNVLDIRALQNCVRKEIWHGWGWSREKRLRFRKQRIKIIEAVRRQLEGFRVFVSDSSPEERILERIEASIMNTLYQHRRFCTIPDEGMWLARSLSSDKPISVTNKCPVKLHGLPAHMEI